MKLSLYIIIILGLAVASSACSSSTNEPPEHPGRPEGEPVPDYSDIVSVSDIRFESDTLHLNFEDGGVLYSISGDNYRFTELSTGDYVIFNPSEPYLRVNGQDARVDTCLIIEMRNGLKWYVLHPNKEIIVVEEELK